MALFVPLDTNWPDNVKVMRVGLAGAGLHAMAMCLAKRTDTDGVLHREQLRRFGADDQLIDLLLAEGLLDPVDHCHRPGEDPSAARTFRVHDWHSRNPSQGAIDARRSEIGARRSEAGRRGNHARYEHDGPFEDCPKCSQTNDENGQVNGTNLANGSQTDSSGLANTRSESESYPESEREPDSVGRSEHAFSSDDRPTGREAELIDLAAKRLQRDFPSRTSPERHLAKLKTDVQNRYGRRITELCSQLPHSPAETIAELLFKEIR